MRVADLKWAALSICVLAAGCDSTNQPSPTPLPGAELAGTYEFRGNTEDTFGYDRTYTGSLILNAADGLPGRYHANLIGTRTFEGSISEVIDWRTYHDQSGAYQYAMHWGDSIRVLVRPDVTNHGGLTGTVRGDTIAGSMAYAGGKYPDSGVFIAVRVP